MVGESCEKVPPLVRDIPNGESGALLLLLTTLMFPPLLLVLVLIAPECEDEGVKDQGNGLEAEGVFGADEG